MIALGGLTLGLVPVLLLLAGLRLLDAYQLVRPREIFASLAIGAGVAALSYLPGAIAIDVFGQDPVLVRRVYSPVFEEMLKAVPMFLLVRRRRVGFLVDAGIHGFAIGTGFAIVENAYYAWTLGTLDLGLWLVRGLGTAILHGSTTAIVGVVTRAIADRRGERSWVAALPGLGIAILVHAAYNQLLLPPLLATAVVLVTMPLLLVAAFGHSERATRHWLGVGLDSDAERLELILSGQVPETAIGTYLESLRSHFPPPVVGDMLCLIRIQTELAMRAKGQLIARAAGIELPVDSSVRANLEELRFLQHSIGPAGRLALAPFLHSSGRETWQVTRLAGARASRSDGGG